MAVISPFICLLPFWEQAKSVGQFGQLKKPDELRAGIRKSLPVSLPGARVQRAQLFAPVICGRSSSSAAAFFHAKLLKRRNVYLKLTRHNGRAGAHGTYNPKHNDRSFNLSNSEHIDPERAKGNIYWDCYHGIRSASDKDKQTAAFSDVEKMFYEIHYAHFVENQNARNAKIRHTERNRTIEDLLAGKKTCPEETIYQFGTLDGLALVEGKVNESKKAKIARPEQAPTDYTAYWVVRPGDKAEPSMQIPGAIIGSEEEARLFEGWFLEDGTRLEDSPYYMGPGADHVGNLDRDVTFYGHWRTAESGEGSPDGGDGFGTLLVGVAVVDVAGVVAYQVGTELILDQLLPAGVAVSHTRAELAMFLWNTAGRPAPATLPAFAEVADPELAQAAQWAIEQGYLKARADGSFKPDKGVAKWRVIRGYRAVTEP